MTDDEKFDHWLQSTARDYNRPDGEVPREALWAAIEGGIATRLETNLDDRPSRAARFTPHLWQAAAALLLVAGGIGIGRVWYRPPGGESPMADGRGRTPSAALDATDAPPSLAANPPAAQDDLSAGHPSASESYDIVTVQHLSRAEALLTSFRTGGDAVAAGGALDRWARDLLADTRLLLDSPAAGDVRRRHLLEDLEMVLAQIVQLPAESSADRALVQRSIERGAMLSRIRSTIPAGFGSGT